MNIFHFLRKNAWLAFILVVVFSHCRKKMLQTKTEELPQPEWHMLLPVIWQVNAAFGGYYVALPPHYFENTDTLPLLVFLHGLGQMGNGSTELPYITYDGIGKLIKDKKFPPYFTVKGKKFSFIVVSPQSSRQPAPDEVEGLIDHISSVYRVDKRRIYLSGLSLGGRVVTLVGGKYPLSVAAIVPIAGVATTPGMEDRCKAIAEANLPVWVLHNADDPLANVSDAEKFISYLIGFNSAIPPRFTVFDAYGHDAWTTALDPNYREDGMNIYEWMLQYTR